MDNGGPDTKLEFHKDLFEIIFLKSMASKIDPTSDFAKMISKATIEALRFWNIETQLASPHSISVSKHGTIYSVRASCKVVTLYNPHSKYKELESDEQTIDWSWGPWSKDKFMTLNNFLMPSKKYEPLTTRGTNPQPYKAGVVVRYSDNIEDVGSKIG